MIRSTQTTQPALPTPPVASHEWTCGLMLIAGITCVPVALVAVARLMLG